MPMRYDKLFALIEGKGLTMYSLRRDKVVGVATLEKMRKGEGHVDTRSLERLCEYLDCQPGDIMEYVPEKGGWHSRKREGFQNESKGFNGAPLRSDSRVGRRAGHCSTRTI